MPTTESSRLFIRRIETAVPRQTIDAERTVEELSARCKGRLNRKNIERMVAGTRLRQRPICALDYQHEREGRGPLFKTIEDQPHGPGTLERNHCYEASARELIEGLLDRLGTHELGRVGSLLTASCTHALSPGFEQVLFEQRLLPPTADHWHLGFMGCAAGLSGLRLLRQMAPLSAEALLLCCELCSLHIQYTDDPGVMVANALFADGAAAAVVSPQPGPVEILDARQTKIPDHAGEMLWTAGDNGFVLELSPKLPDTLREAVPGVVDDLLERNALRRGDIANWLIHPGGPAILETCGQALGLSSEALRHSWEVFGRYGNLSSATAFFIIKQALSVGVEGPSVALGFAPGLTAEATLLDLRPSQSS